MKLNNVAFEQAKKLITDGKVEKDQRDDWSEDASSTDEQNKFIEKNGMDSYAKWFLAVDGDADNKTSYKFPYGDLNKVHRGAVIAAKVRAGQYKHEDIENKAGELLKMIDTK